MEFHEYANIYRLLECKDFQAMVASIKGSGQRNPITLFEGKILDGRNRYRACIEAGVKPHYATYEGDDPIGEIAILNDIRRHDNENERGLVGARMARLKHGSNQHQKEDSSGELSSTPLVTIERAAELAGSTVAMVKRGKQIIGRGSDELIRALEKKEITMKSGVDLARLPIERQREVIAEGPEAVMVKVKEIRENGGAEIAPSQRPFDSSKRIVYRPALGNEILRKAIATMDTIGDTDKEFESVFQQMIDYCQKRLTRKRK